MNDPHGTHESWHLSKSVPISVILFLLAQTVGVLIWGVKIDSRVSVLETVDTHTIARIARLEDLIGRIIVLEERQRAVIILLERNGERLDKLLTK